MSEVFVETWGTGTPVVLVHGSLATGRDEWAAQQPLAEAGYRLLVLDRRGYGRSPAAEREDFVRDADDIVEIMAGGAHLVGHSYGGLGAMLAAARCPEETLSLALLEPPVFSLARGEGAAQATLAQLRTLLRDEADSDAAWLSSFLQAVGTDLDTLPQGVLDEVIPLVPLLRRGRPPWEADLPLAALAAATFPKVVVTGGHHPGFDAVCDELGKRIGATRAVVAGAGHEIQFAGQQINELLLELWNRA